MGLSAIGGVMSGGIVPLLFQIPDLTIDIAEEINNQSTANTTELSLDFPKTNYKLIKKIATRIPGKLDDALLYTLYGSSILNDAVGGASGKSAVEHIAD